MRRQLSTVFISVLSGLATPKAQFRLCELGLVTYFSGGKINLVGGLSGGERINKRTDSKMRD